MTLTLQQHHISYANYGCHLPCFLLVSARWDLKAKTSTDVLTAQKKEETYL